MSDKYSLSSNQRERDEAAAYFYSLTDKTASNEMIIRLYDQSVDKYEKNMAVVNFTAHLETSATLARLYPRNRDNIHILDVAAGTGQCAIELQKLGFQKMDALDASEEMLEVAKNRGLYGRYIHNMLGENTLDIEDNTYNAITICSMASVIMKRLPVKAFEELTRVVKSGGYIVNCGFYSDLADGTTAKEFRTNMNTLESQGKWKQVEVKRFKGYIFGYDGAVSIHRVC